MVAVLRWLLVLPAATVTLVVFGSALDFFHATFVTLLSLRWAREWYTDPDAGQLAYFALRRVIPLFAAVYAGAQVAPRYRSIVAKVLAVGFVCVALVGQILLPLSEFGMTSLLDAIGVNALVCLAAYAACSKVTADEEFRGPHQASGP